MTSLTAAAIAGFRLPRVSMKLCCRPVSEPNPGAGSRDAFAAVSFVLDCRGFSTFWEGISPSADIDKCGIYGKIFSREPHCGSTSGWMAERSKATDCKSVGESLRWFEPNSNHHFLYPNALTACNTSTRRRLSSVGRAHPW